MRSSASGPRRTGPCSTRAACFPPPARWSGSPGKVTVVDGPFTEAKEVIGGYAMWQVRSKEEAVEAARQFIEFHADLWPGYEGVCKVRQVMDPADFGPPQQ